MQTLSFKVGGQAYILRVNLGNFEVTFQKEGVNFTHFAWSTLPIPSIWQVGRLGD